MRIQIDVSVFASPTEAFGNATGELDVLETPKERQAFPWPEAWVTEKPTFFSAEQSTVMSVTGSAGMLSVMLYGIVCESVAEARDCATFLELRGGLFFDEY